MTSIEWLIEKSRTIPINSYAWDKVIKQAKEMHKAEIIDAIINYVIQKADRDINFKSLEHGVKIENVDMAKMIFGEDEGSSKSELPQQEISDEEIEEASLHIKTSDYKVNTNTPFYHVEKAMWRIGAKWYREKLKQRQ